MGKSAKSRRTQGDFSLNNSQSPVYRAFFFLMDKAVKIWRLFLWVGLAGLFCVIIWRYTVPLGKVVYQWLPGASPAFISKLTPEERVSVDDQGQWELSGFPVYFSLRTTRPYNRLKLTIKYRGSASPLAEVGLMTDGFLKRYDLEPFYNNFLDGLLAGGKWKVMEENGTMLLQQTKKYASLKDFWAKPPKAEEVAVFNYQWPAPTKLNDYKPGPGYSMNYPIVGAVEMMTYIKNEKLSLRIEAVDLHKNQTVDDAVLEVRNEKGQLVASEKMADTGSGKQGQPELRQLTLTKVGLPEGLYRLNWRASDEIQISRLVTAQSKFTFVSRMKLALFNQPIKLVLAGPNLQAATIEPAGLQDIKAASTTLSVNESYHNFTWILPCKAAACPLVLAKGGLSLATNGYLAPEAKALVFPAVSKIDAFFKLDPKIKYIVANYRQPIVQGDWHIATVDFDLAKAYRENGRYGLLLNLPEMPESARLVIGEIRAEASGQSVWQSILNLWGKK